ncbi:hypothetical protein IJG93_03025 [Candidatus Saccharibacteria bacterium]|nr:hypothetical protein [Candidatus Saccharibacteria bacterium]
MNDIITKFAANNSTNTSRQNVGTNVKVVGDGSDTLWDNIKTIINAVIGVLGIVCVIVIIIGGINYMTSSGDAGKVKKAKDTILYGVIGLVVCVLAFAIVNFVINNILGS